MYSRNDYRYYLENRLMHSDDFLAHYGVKGMKWKNHKTSTYSDQINDPKLSGAAQRNSMRLTRTSDGSIGFRNNKGEHQVYKKRKNTLIKKTKRTNEPEVTTRTTVDRKNRSVTIRKNKKDPNFPIRKFTYHSRSKIGGNEYTYTKTKNAEVKKLEFGKKKKK